MARPVKIAFAGLGASLLLAILLAVGVAVYQARRPVTGEPAYVALGSSFAAGAGLGRLQPNSPTLCARSVDGYPQQLARTTGLAIVDMSCGGAVTRHLRLGGQFFQGPQLRVIDRRTRLVTVTVGGNDVGYVGDLSLLAARKGRGPLGWIARQLWTGPKALEARPWDTFSRELIATIRQIRSMAPGARIIVVSYPTILPPAGTCERLGLDAQDADLMRQIGDRLAATTASAAAASDAEFVDMNALGAAHNACSSAPWTNGWLNAGAAPFHPTLAGAIATAEAVRTEVGAFPQQ